MMVKIHFLGAARTVTGSAFLLEGLGKKILVDFGMFQGPQDLRMRNRRNFSFEPEELDFMLLTHAHIDHSGLIPRLYKEGFNGNVITTEATADLCKIMLPDSGHIQEMEVEWKNRKRSRAGKAPLEPLYTADEALEALQIFKGFPYGQKIELSPGIYIRFQDAGHILGSAIIELWFEAQGEKMKVVFSGDLGSTNQPIICDPTIIKEADYVIMESTYGKRFHEGKEEKVNKLLMIIKDTIARGGNVVIPAFAVERTQEILYYLNYFVQNRIIPSIPVYVDSPLAISATKIFKEHLEVFDKETQALLEEGDDPFWFPGLAFTRKVEESMAINEVDESAIIISASGMAEAGRIKHHLKYNLWRPESSVVFVGYQAQGTLGRSILEGAKKVKIFGEEIAVRAHVHSISGFSAHADQNGLLKWLNGFEQKPKKVFLVHGEEEGSLALEKKINGELGLATYVPQLKDCILLKPQATQTVSEDDVMDMDAVRKERLQKQMDALATQLVEMKRLMEEDKPKSMDQIEDILEDIGVINQATSTDR